MSRNQRKEQGNKGREDKGHGGGTKNDWCLKETARIFMRKDFEKEKLAMRQAFDFDAEKAEALSEQRLSFDKEKAKALSEQQLLVDFDKEMKAALGSLRCFAGRQVLTTGLQRVRTGRLRQLGRPGAPHGERQDPFLPFDAFLAGSLEHLCPRLGQVAFPTRFGTRPRRNHIETHISRFRDPKP